MPEVQSRSDRVQVPSTRQIKDFNRYELRLSDTHLDEFWQRFGNGENVLPTPTANNVVSTANVTNLFSISHSVSIRAFAFHYLRANVNPSSKQEDRLTKDGQLGRPPASNAQHAFSTGKDALKQAGCRIRQSPKNQSVLIESWRGGRSSPGKPEPSTPAPYNMRC